MLTPQPDTLLDRLRRLEDRIDQVARGTLGRDMVSVAGISIRSQGGLTVKDSNGQSTLFVGGLTQPTSEPHTALRTVHEEASGAGALRLAIWDKAGNVIFSDDTPSGAGIGRPYIGGTLSPYRTADWPATQSADWDPLQRWMFNRQHPRIHAIIHAATDLADTTGEARLRDLATNTVLGTVTVAADTAGGLVIGPVAMPGVFGDVCEVRLEVHRTTGTGTVRATLAYAVGMQS
ncbi:hypothetical protein [Kutzneria buriramensis]|uniref:Uncharacterized protein n=1 Tax=Kutzneria buriramensis TaxID=1045776 RepID=A0A3E0HD00_9PSEU|nr:hypothetical protein [Kutzneria buriramensis]REH42730.1 hypothetical protein BCF44_110227 [Kutzneria buriramensis]